MCVTVVSVLIITCIYVTLYLLISAENFRETKRMIIRFLLMIIRAPIWNWISLTIIVNYRVQVAPSMALYCAINFTKCRYYILVGQYNV